MKYAHLATRLYNAPLLLLPTKAEVIEQVFRAHQEGRGALLSPDASEIVPRHEAAAAMFQRVEGGFYRSSEGIALIPVLGSLIQRGDGLDALSGLTGYNRISGMLQAALDDPQVGGILLEVDSPGGEANGAFDLAAKIAVSEQRKPTWVAVNEQAFSAAYLISSGAGRISVPESGMVGSIGVVLMHVDQSAKDEKQGITYTPIYAGARKVDYSSHAPLSKAARATAQEEVDRVYDMFVGTVATGRNIQPDVVRNTEAALLNPRAAMAVGLVDAVETFDQTVAALAEEVAHIRMTGQRSSGAPASTHDNGGFAMTTQQVTPQVQSTTAVPGTAAAAPVPVAAAPVPGAESSAERARIAGILGHAEAAGRRALAEHLAFKTTNTVEEAVALLAVSPKEAPAAPANLLAAAMAGIKNPEIGATASADSAEPAAKVATAAEVYEFRRKCVENARRAQ